MNPHPPPTRPRVSVVIPVRNAAPYIRAALESVVRQTHPPFEIIVVDDGSTDESAAIAASVDGVRVIRQAGGGAALARNRAIPECSGEVIAFQDADDLWDDTKTERQVAWLLAHPDVWCSICHRLDFLDESVTYAQASWCPPDDLTIPQPSFSTGTIVCWRRLFDVVGLFDPTFVIAHDLDWFARVRAHGHQIGVLGDVLYRRRIHAGNLCADENRLRAESFRVYRTSARRQRPVAPRPLAIGVIIPAFNASATIAEAVASALAQSIPPVEIVVVDDGSSDDTCEVVSSIVPSVTLVRRPHGGIASARNHGVREASAPWLAFLDSDDRWPDDALATLSAPLAKEPALDVVTGRFLNVPQDRWDAVVSGGDTSDLVVHQGAGTASLIRRALFDRIGLFDYGMRVGEFVDWRLRATDAGARMEGVSGIVQWRRVHDANTSVRERRAYGDYARAIKAALDRRRASGAPGARGQLT